MADSIKESTDKKILDTMTTLAKMLTGGLKKRTHIITASASYHGDLIKNDYQFTWGGQSVTSYKLEALERLYRSTGLIFLQWQKKFLTIIIQSLHFSSLKKKGMEKTCEKRRKKW